MARFLCLIYLDESELAAMTEPDMSALNAEHLRYNSGLHANGHFVEAEALTPASHTACVRVRNGKRTVTDGPFVETKEMVAGFYLIEARDITEAAALAAEIPAARLGTVEVRPTRHLIVDGQSHPPLSYATAARSTH